MTVGTSGPALALDGMSIGYAEPLAEPVTLHLAAGEFVAVTGPSGCGKSTLLATIAGLVPALAGRITVTGRDVTSQAPQRRDVGIVFQEPLLFPHLDVGGNIAYGLRRHGLSKRAADERAGELLAWVDLAGFERRDVRALSGGQAQRVALARALAPQPAVMLLDEPFSALDPELRARLGTEVRDLLTARACATLYVTHDPDEAQRLGDRVIRLDARTSP